MMVYMVELEVDSLIVDKWLDWVRPHMDEVLETGCFTSGALEKVLDPNSDVPTYVIRYTFNELKDFKKYEAEYATELRKEGAKLFGDHMKAKRSITEMLHFGVEQDEDNSK